MRDLDPAEREALEAGPVTVIGASPVETLVAVSNALDRAPVYVHLDLDVIDPEQMPAQFPAPDGLMAEKLFDVLEAVAETSELVGLEVTASSHPTTAEERQAAGRDRHARARAAAGRGARGGRRRRLSRRHETLR